MFTYARKRGYLPKDRPHEVVDIERPKVRGGPILVFRKLDDAEYNNQHWHRGMSWTLSKHVAYFFGHYCTSSRRVILFGADRKSAPMIAEAIVEKRFVLAYINERKEEELVIDPDCPLEKLAFRSVPRNWKFRKPGA
jgi:hypothetical protein